MTEASVHEGTLASWYDVHDALRKELATLAAGAARLVPKPRQLEAFEVRIEFLRMVLSAHSTAEDAVLFPFMRLHGLPVATDFEAEHLFEAGAVYDIRRNLVEARLIGDYEESQRACSRALAGLQRMRTDLNAHLDKEEREVIPDFVKAFPEDVQTQLFQAVIAATPKELRMSIISWVARSVPLTRAVKFLRDVVAAAPDETTMSLASAIRENVGGRRWHALSRQVAGLADGA